MSAKIGFFASGGGSNFQAIHRRILSGELEAQASVLITNNGRCGAAEYARSQNIPVVHISGKTHPDPQEAQDALLTACADLDLIVLAGYMKMLPGALVQKFQGRLLNIHPSLLPAFGGEGCYGIHVHEKVLTRGAQFTGITVHLVTEEYDEGPILWQNSLRVHPDWTPTELQTQVLALEHQDYWRCVQAVLQGKLQQDSAGRPWIARL
jgi:phosphoribosylglycinamide formyltransferase 1